MSNTPFDRAPGSRATTRRANISKADLETVFWRHRLKFRADYIRDDTPYWKRYLLETLASALSTQEKILNIVLCVHADGDSGENARPCLDRIQALSGLSRPFVVKYLSAEKGWLLKTGAGAGRAPNTYSVVIPQKTITELVERVGERSSKPGLPLAQGEGDRSSKRDLPLKASGQPDLPLEPPVAVNGINRYGDDEVRSGKRERRSGKRGLPDTIDTNKHAKRKARRSRLPESFVLPDEWRDYPRKTYGLSDFQIDCIAREWHRYWTGPDAKNDGEQADWFRTWCNRIDALHKRGEFPPDQNGGASPSSYGPNGQYRGVRL